MRFYYKKKMDLEGLAKRMLKSGKSDEEIIQRLISEYFIYKNLNPEILRGMAAAILEESKRSSVCESAVANHPILADILLTKGSDVSMGEFGVGCRG